MTLIQRLRLAIIVLLITTSSFASQWYASVGVGGMHPEYARDTRINNNSGLASPFNMDIYRTNQKNQVSVMAEVGKQWPRSYQWLQAISLGMQYQHIFATDIGRNITQYSDPDFLNYNYQLDLSSNLLLLNARLDFPTWYQTITPFVLAGAGINQLIVSNYGESALPGVTAARTSADFRRYADLQFTYQVGAGVGVQVDPDTRVAINYVYQELGALQTEYGTAAWSNSKLDFGNLYAHSIYITLTRMLV